jgi:hypothetical protein
MKKLVCLIIAAFVLASVSSVDAAGLAKHHHGKKAAKHHKVHHAKIHRFKRA